MLMYRNIGDSNTKEIEHPFTRSRIWRAVVYLRCQLLNRSWHMDGAI